MSQKISADTLVSVFNDADYFPLIQGGDNLRITKSLLRALLFASTADGGAIRYDSTAADWIVDDRSGYRTVNTGRYTASPSSTSVLLMSNTSDMAVGLPVRYVISGTTYYGIITAFTANTSITIAGASLSGSLTALAVGPASKVVQLLFPMTEAANFSANTGSTQLATFGLTYFKWRMPKAYLVTFSGIEQTTAGATEPKINVLIAGSAVSTNDTNLGIALAAATWVDNSAIAINTANYDINWDESIEFDVTNTPSTAADYLTISCTFVLE